jgi:glutamyl-tRNA(Gln) amidotransferase subunit D
MYAEKITELLTSKGIAIGDRVSLSKGDMKVEGLVMPQTTLGDSTKLVLKMDSGYNAGFAVEGAVLEKSTHAEPKAVKEEEEYELGKVKKSLLTLEFDTSKPPISIIATGGTIASRVNYLTGGVNALEDPREFLHNVPELASFVNVRKLVSLKPKMTEDMAWKDWEVIAQNVCTELNAETKGVIVTLGTDMLHYAAAAVSFFLNAHKPVIFVGAQRSSDRGSSDAGMNLICAAHAALSDIGEVGACMHGSIEDSYCLFIRGTKVRKLHTSRRDAFRPVNDLPLAKIFPSGKINSVNPVHKKRKESAAELDAKHNPNVALIKIFPGSDPGVLDYYREKGIRGFVIEGTGLGHVPTMAERSWIEPVKRIVKDGIPVVVTSQTIYGRVNPDVYVNLRILFHEAKAIPGEDMLSEVAYIKLGWVLGHTQDIEEVRKQMLTNRAGEITERSLPETFLY